MQKKYNNIPDSDNYILLDSGNLQKLEQVGRYRLIRPALNAYWPPSLSEREWEKAIGTFKRNSSGGGMWQWKQQPPLSWKVNMGDNSLLTSRTNLGN
jgi:23S rRNA (cytosine1962-C5)-methyltransferase